MVPVFIVCGLTHLNVNPDRRARGRAGSASYSEVGCLGLHCASSEFRTWVEMSFSGGGDNPRIPRRRLLGAVALCAIGAPFGSFAQQSGRVWRVGFLALRRPVSLEFDQFGGFSQGTRELGYVEDRNLLIERRLADGESERLPVLAAELVQIKVDVIVAAGTQAIGTAQKATASTPIVIAGANDPVASGFVASRRTCRASSRPRDEQPLDGKSFDAYGEYTRARRLREGGGIAKLVAIDGYPAEKWEDALRESAKLELRF